MKLGYLIERMRKLDPKLFVYFDFCDMCPEELISWRGGLLRVMHRPWSRYLPSR